MASSFTAIEAVETLGQMRLGRRVHRRSAMMPAAAMEHRMIGSIIQPPALTSSHTVVHPPRKSGATLA